MRMIIYQRTVAGKVIVGSVETKMGVGNSGTRHVYAVNNLLKEGGRVLVREDVVNGGSGMGGRKAKCTAYLTKGINKSHDKRLESHDHRTNDRKSIRKRSWNKQSETDQGAIIERAIGNRSRSDHRTNNQKQIKE